MPWCGRRRKHLLRLLWRSIRFTVRFHQYKCSKNVFLPSGTHMVLLPDSVHHWLHSQVFLVRDFISSFKSFTMKFSIKMTNLKRCILFINRRLRFLRLMKADWEIWQWDRHLLMDWLENLTFSVAPEKELKRWDRPNLDLLPPRHHTYCRITLHPTS